uniref:Ceramide kinase-like n=1 Tax=Sinocyclocheilus grahami TaxID=75366 RepID=A0A672NU87_SINGR
MRISCLSLPPCGPKVNYNNKIIFFFILLQFGFSFIETHTVKAVKLRPHSQGSCADDVSEENEECDSKTMPIISSERTYPWNIDGDLLEVPSELLIRVHPKLLTLFGADMEEAPVKCSCI